MPLFGPIIEEEKWGGPRSQVYDTPYEVGNRIIIVNNKLLQLAGIEDLDNFMGSDFKSVAKEDVINNNDNLYKLLDLWEKKYVNRSVLVYNVDINKAASLIRSVF